MTVRVAIGNFYLELMDSNALGDDEQGLALVKAYKARLKEIMGLITGVHSQ
jgi:hypothetical protein